MTILLKFGVGNVLYFGEQENMPHALVHVIFFFLRYRKTDEFVIILCFESETFSLQNRTYLGTAANEARILCSQPAPSD